MIYIIVFFSLINVVSLHAMQQEIMLSCLDPEKNAQIQMTMPIEIVGMSEILKVMINELGGNDTITNKNGTISIKWENMHKIAPIPVTPFCSTIKDLCKELKYFNTNKTLNTEEIKNSTLEKLITMSNAFHYFDFRENNDLAAQWDEKIYGRIYQQCKDMSWNEIKYLYPDPLHLDLARIIFCRPIINKIKFELIKRAFADNRKVELPTKAGISDGAAFSPNNKMLATTITNFRQAQGSQSLITISFLENNTITPESKENILKIENYWRGCGKFSHDSKKFIIGSDNNILIYTINDEGVISEKPVQTLELSSQYNHDKKHIISLSPDGKLIACYDGYDLFLWQFNIDDGTINESSKRILKIDTNTWIISPIQFDDEGTIRIISKNHNTLKSTLYIFNPNGTLNSQADINEILFNASFYTHHKKFAATVHTDTSRFSRELSLYVYDFSDIENISNKFISSDFFDDHIAPCMILDDTAMIAKISQYLKHSELALIDINNDTNSIKLLPLQKLDFKNFYISADNKKIVVEQSADPYILYTLLTPQEEEPFNAITQLDIEPILLLDKVLRKTEDISVLNEYDIAEPIMDLLREIGFKIEKKTDKATVAAIPQASTTKTDQPEPKLDTNLISVAAAMQHQQTLEKEKNEPATIQQPTQQPQGLETIPQPELEPEDNNPKPVTWQQIFLDIYSRVSSFISSIIEWLWGSNKS